VTLSFTFYVSHVNTKNWAAGRNSQWPEQPQESSENIADVIFMTNNAEAKKKNTYFPC